MFFSESIPVRMVINKNTSKMMMNNIENLENGSSLNVNNVDFVFVKNDLIYNST